MTRIEVGRIVVGADYRFHAMAQRKTENGVVVEDVEGGTYRVFAFAFDGLTYQERVIYVGLDGPDEGRYFCCPIGDFAVKFRALEETSAANEATEKTAGHIAEPWRTGA